MWVVTGGKVVEAESLDAYVASVMHGAPLVGRVLAVQEDPHDDGAAKGGT